MDKPLRVGVIGCGGIAQMMHLPFLFERPDLFEVKGLCDCNRAVLEAVGRQFRCNALFDDVSELLKTDIEAVLILSSGSHKDLVIQAAKASKHIFVEKPLAENLEEVMAIAEAVRNANVVLMVGYHKRYDPGYRLAREQVRALKDLRFVRAEILHPVDAQARTHYYLHPPIDEATLQRLHDESKDGLLEIAGTSQTVEKIVGSNAPTERRVATFLLFNSVIHDVNALRGILGEPRDVLFADFYRNGRVIHVVLKWTELLHGTITWVYLPGLRHYKEELLFLSPEARVSLIFPSPYYRHFPTPVVVESMEGSVFSEKRCIVSYDEAFRLELHHFYDCVRKGTKCETGLEDAIADTILLEKIATFGL